MAARRAATPRAADRLAWGWPPEGVEREGKPAATPKKMWPVRPWRFLWEAEAADFVECNQTRRDEFQAKMAKGKTVTLEDEAKIDRAMKLLIVNTICLSLCHCLSLSICLYLSDCLSVCPSLSVFKITTIKN